MALGHANGGAPSVAGWYGKMPCLGDFASRRLPSDFIAAWDAWLQRSIAASRRDLGEHWLDVFLTSPMWRFALGPAICGAHAWTGLVFPSVDKVGRYFPMTFALPLPAGVVAAPEWYDALEHIGLAALDIAYSPDALERALSGHPCTPSPEAGDAPADGHSRWWCIAHDTGAVASHRCAGLPAESHFTVMLRGSGQADATSVDPLQAFDEARR